MSLTAAGLTFAYGDTPALMGAGLTVSVGEILAIVGPSGSGKSTLLHCLSGLLRPDSGSIHLDAIDLMELPEDELVKLRRKHFGFVFQFAELVPELSVAENVSLPLELLGWSRRAARGRVREILAQLDVEDLAGRKPGRVSGGQAQRVAIARALVHEPSVVFADEPTGALDSVSGQLALDALVGRARGQGAAVVLVTHDESVAARADRRIEVRDGRVHTVAAVGP